MYAVFLLPHVCFRSNCTCVRWIGLVCLFRFRHILRIFVLRFLRHPASYIHPHNFAFPIACLLLWIAFYFLLLSKFFSSLHFFIFFMHWVCCDVASFIMCKIFCSSNLVRYALFWSLLWHFFTSYFKLWRVWRGISLSKCMYICN